MRYRAGWPLINQQRPNALGKEEQVVEGPKSGKGGELKSPCDDSESPILVEEGFYLT